MTVYRLRNKKDIYVSKETFWESILDDTYMALSNIFVLWVGKEFFDNIFIPCIMLWIIMIALITRFKEKQIDVDDFKELLDEVQDEQKS